MSMVEPPIMYPFVKVIHLESGHILHGWYLGIARSHGSDFFAVAVLDTWHTDDEVRPDIRMLTTSAWLIDSPSDNAADYD